MRGRHAAPPRGQTLPALIQRPPPAPTRPRPTGSRERARPRLRPVRVSWSAAAGLAIISIMIVFCFAGPLFYRPDLSRVNLLLSNLPPSAHHLLGTDADGIDVLGRLMTGGRISLEVGVAAGSLAATIGTLWGAVAGYVGGAADAIMMRLVDAGLAIPVIIVLLLLTSIYSPNPVLLVLVIAATSWLSTARLVRGQALTLRSREFVQAVMVMGGSRIRIIVRHIAPNVFGTIAVNVSFQIADAIVVLATLSFLGLGVQAPSSDWGDMIAAGVQSIYSGHWWQLYPAGVAIIAVVVAFNLVGDSLAGRGQPETP